MGLRQRVLAGSARQLGHPSGWRGRLISRALNRGNHALVQAAVDATDVAGGQAAADIGFGGGVGLGLLLDRVGPSGTVHGIDVSTTMVVQARRRMARQCAAGRLSLEIGSMTDLPLVDDVLDAVITVNTVYFVDDLEAAFKELARVLRPGGRLAVGVADPVAMARMPVTAYGFRLRPIDELAAAMTAAGLVDVRTERLPGPPVARHLVIGTA
jgi:ubiquinone/menaquinone biosynthesis C-methylase UbiE